MPQASSLAGTKLGPSGTALAGDPGQGRMRWFADGLFRVLNANGHTFCAEGTDSPHLVVNFADAREPRPFRRKSQGTFVITVVEVREEPEDLLKAAYPILVRSLSNLLIYAVNPTGADWRTYFVTLEQGYYPVETGTANEDAYFGAVYQRLAPLANSRLVVNNHFARDLPPDLWEGNANTRALRWAGQLLDQMDLLPAPFPLTEMLPERDIRHVQRLFGLGGLSYGNLSVREDARSFWMSARGVNKGSLQVIGRDMLLITGYDPRRRSMAVRIPPGVEPRRASVDAIEHWMIYAEHPQVGAIVHVHAWMDGIPSTSVNYPCGTAELATEVAELLRRHPDPSRAVIGLRNHGLTITGRSLADIFERITGKLQPQVPMT